ncbi:hypothetical protein OPU39_06095, partial [Acinetobacter nosocomialis]|nr:hypothetical protein [Acinetobacter nosocomialis]
PATPSQRGRLKAPQAVLALGSDYPADTLLDTHSHRRAQFLYAPEGLMKVETEDGQWLVLPYSGVWIPAGKAHQVWLSKVSTYSLYIEVSNAPRQANYCEVVQVSPLMHQLLIQANQLAACIIYQTIEFAEFL